MTEYYLDENSLPVIKAEVKEGQIRYWDFINCLILVENKYPDRDVNLWAVQTNTPIHTLSEEFISVLTYVGELDA